MTDKQLNKKYWFGTGRRKSAVAQVRLYEKEDFYEVNSEKKTPDKSIVVPMELVGVNGSFGISVRVCGGGFESQIEAIRLGVARALVKYNQEFRLSLKKAGLLTRDPREKERKKPGLKGARRAPQWAKR